MRDGDFCVIPTVCHGHPMQAFHHCVLSEFIQAKRNAKSLAERRGFEPRKPFWSLHAFQACLFNHSSISPSSKVAYDIETRYASLGRRTFSSQNNRCCATLVLVGLLYTLLPVRIIQKPDLHKSGAKLQKKTDMRAIVCSFFCFFLYFSPKRDFALAVVTIFI